MFDPKTSGKTLSIVTIPIPTSGVNVEVKTELLWMTIVNKAPIFFRIIKPLDE
jgi:hypothetical protein